MITPENLSNAARRLYEQWEAYEVDGAAEGWPIATLAAAAAAPIDDLYDLIMVPEVPWAPAFDPELAAEVLRPEFAREVLQWLGQFVGLRPADLPPAASRIRILETNNARRGGVDSIMAAARQRAIGPDGTPDSATVIVLDRVGGDPYHLAVTMYLSEVADRAAVIRDIESVLPAGRRGLAPTWTNYVTNPSFEVNTTGWQTVNNGWSAGATITRNTAEVLALASGSASARITTAGAGSANSGAYIALGVLPAGTYRVSLFVYQTNGNTLDLVAGPATGPTLLQRTSANGLQRLSGLITSNGSIGSVMGLRNTFGANWSTGPYIDGAMVTAGETLYPYGDGSTMNGDGHPDGMSWTGTAHASTSNGRGVRPRFDFNLVTGGDFNTLTGAFANFADVTAEFATFDQLTANPLGL